MTYKVRVEIEDGYTIVAVDADSETEALEAARRAVLPHSAFHAEIIR